MRVALWRRLFVLTVAGVIAGSCDAARDPVGPGRPTAKVQPMCQLGCQEQDPYPEYPGYFLGSLLSPDECFGESINDSDGDGLSDHCEHVLAASFAPELYYHYGDNVAREPHWVARSESGNMVRLGYLLSYYRDEGSSAYVCELPFANLIEPSCDGHNGDSESIFLRVYYDAGHQHWILDNAWYSRHGVFSDYTRGHGGNNYPRGLVYPEKLGGYPRTYVSQGKHANYGKGYECDEGGFLWTDTCVGNDTAVRVETGGQWLNLGSRAYRLLDCMMASSPAHPYYGSGAQECYWTELGSFRGWYPDYVGGPAAESYTTILARHGF